MRCHRRAFVGVLGAPWLASGRVAASHESGDRWLPRADHHNTAYAPVSGPPAGLEERWRRTFDAAVSAAPGRNGDRAYLGLASGQIVAVRIGSGERAWRVDLDDAPALVVTATDERLFVPTASQSVYGLQRNDGAELWRYDASEPVRTPVTTVDGLVLFGTESGRVIAVDAGAGESLWSAQLPDEIAATPALTGDLVIVRDRAGTVACLDSATGEERWRREYRTGTVPGTFGGPVVRDGLVIAAGATEEGSDAASRQLVALDAVTGARRWDRDVDQGIVQLACSPDRLFAFDGGTLYALNPTDGSTLWRDETEAGVTRLFAVEDALYSVALDAVTVYDPATGTVRTRFDPNGGLTGYLPGADETVVTSGPLPIQGGVVVTYDDAVVEIGAEDGLGALELAGSGGALGVLGYATWRVWRGRGLDAPDGPTGEAD